MGSERRSAERRSRRLEVRFWRGGKDQAFSGFTTNISTSGLFLGTTQSLQPGERIRIELVDRIAGFIIEGQVARVHRVAIPLRHVDQPGAGIRFLEPDELISALVPALRDRSASARRRAMVASSEEEGALERGAANNGDRATDDPVDEGADAGTDPPSAGDAPRIEVDFSDRSSFLSVYHRDLSAGTLFVSTDVPAAVDDVVLIELHPPVESDRPLCFEAKVVHRFEPKAAVGNGRNVLAGMGVRFADVEGLKKALEPVLTKLRS